MEAKMLQILKKIGLSDGEILVYETLLNYGEMGAGAIIVKTKLKRGDCYNKIYDLVQKGLVEEFTKDKKKHFRLEHPNKVEEYIERRQNEIQATHKEIAAMMPGLVSTFNLAYHKPGVKYFEGEDGLRIIMEDTIKQGEEILSYVDIETFEKYYEKLNNAYLKERYKKAIHKRNLLPYSGYSSKYALEHNNEFTDCRLIKVPKGENGISMNIYGDKVSFQTFKRNSLISIIIEDKTITVLLRGFFDFLWENAQSL